MSFRRVEDDGFEAEAMSPLPEGDALELFQNAVEKFGVVCRVHSLHEAENFARLNYLPPEIVPVRDEELAVSVVPVVENPTEPVPILQPVFSPGRSSSFEEMAELIQHAQHLPQANGEKKLNQKSKDMLEAEANCTRYAYAFNTWLNKDF